jgi:hypothetical protein
MMMNRRRWRSIAAAAALAVGQAGLVAAPLLFTGVASAQTAVQAQSPRVTAFDVRPLDRIEPGAELEFTVWGTPGSDAVLSIDGAQRVLRLVESSPGVYQGVYTIGVRDRIAPDSRVTANLRRGNRVGTACSTKPCSAVGPRRRWRSGRCRASSASASPTAASGASARRST